MVQTFDGKAVSDMLGFNPAERFGNAGRMELRDDAPVQKTQPATSSGRVVAGNDDVSHIGMQKAAEMVKKLPASGFQPIRTN